jgi:hypothetical protein
MTHQSTSRNLAPFPNPLSPAIALTMILLIFSSTGCRYEYDLVEPAKFAAHVGTHTDYLVAIDPLEYRLITVDSRLVLRAYNPTDAPIALLGDRSTVVDPTGQSHPLRNQTIAPHSFIKLILPPLRPQLEPAGPYIGISASYSERHAMDQWGDLPGQPPGNWPPSYYVADGDDTLWWNWDGQTAVRLTLLFERKSGTFTNTFVFKRIKM